MRAGALVCGLVLCLVAATARADFVDGNKLQQYLAAYDRALAGRGTGQDYDEASYAQGYVSGVIDANIAGTSFCASPTVSLAQAVAVIERRLREHPEDWNNAASDIVVKAMSTSFPCRPK